MKNIIKLMNWVDSMSTQFMTNGNKVNNYKHLKQN